MNKAKPLTATQIDKACRADFIVLYGDRLVMGAVAHRKFEVTIKGRVWVNMEDDLSWHYVDAGQIVITETKRKKRRKIMPSGKGRPGAPTHLKLATKKTAKIEASKESGAAAEAAKPKRKGGGSVVVSRTGGKQGELPGVETSKRKIAEIEDLAEIYDEKKAAKAKATEDFNDADENLAVSMKKHNRTSYSRKTWGRVVLKQSKEHVSFKRETSKSE